MFKILLEEFMIVNYELKGLNAISNDKCHLDCQCRYTPKVTSYITSSLRITTTLDLG